jgi:hypothetical protein
MIRNSLQTAKTANEISRQTLLASQGPQVYLTKTTLLRLKPNEKIAVELEVKNFGHLAADNVSVGSVIDSRAGDPAQNIKLTVPQSGANLPPELPKTVIFETNEVISPQQIRAIEGGQLNLYVYGVLQYESPLEPGVITYFVYCSRHRKSSLPDSDWVGCPYTPELVINGKPLLHTHELQRMPK